MSARELDAVVDAPPRLLAAAVLARAARHAADDNLWKMFESMELALRLHTCVVAALGDLELFGTDRHDVFTLVAGRERMVARDWNGTQPDLVARFAVEACSVA